MELSTVEALSAIELRLTFNDELDETAFTGSDETTTTSESVVNNGNVATIREVFSFGSGPKKYIGLILGCISAAVAGAVGPFMIFYFANAFSDLVADPTSDEYMENVKELAYIFLILG